MTKQQKKAIEKVKGPCIILAGPGTGKTYTLVNKVKYIVNNNHYNPKEILCLTFSNEATNELKNRLAKELQRSSDIVVRTFHSFCSDIIKEHGNKIGIKEEFQILEPNDAKIFLNKNYNVAPYWANRYINTINNARDYGISLNDIRQHTKKLKQKFKEIQKLDEYAEKLEIELNTLHLSTEDSRLVNTRKKEIKEFLKNYREYKKYNDFMIVWDNYINFKKENNFIDYSDLNNYVLKLFRKYGSKEVAEKFKYIFVDEFQDTNKLQFELIEFLGKEHKNITIVGDPNQSIYGFRGAYRESFNHFKKVFNVKSNEEFTLDKSYRSPNTILSISHNLIKNNYDDQSECFEVKNANGIQGEKVKCYELINYEEEARKVSELVLDQINNGVEKKEICVVIRTHRQEKTIKDAIENKGISTISAGESNLLSTPEIKTVISYLYILNNLINNSQTSDQAWWNLFHYKNNLSPKDTFIIGKFIKKNRKKEIRLDELLFTNLENLNLSLNGKNIVNKIVSKLSKLTKHLNKTVPDIIKEIYEVTGLNRAFSHERSPENIESLMNLREFYNLAQKYFENHDKSLNSFVRYLEVINTLGVNIPASRIKNVNAVRIMTIHATKGLEFHTVIVTNLANNRFPITRTRNEPLIPKELLPEQKKIIENAQSQKEADKLIKEYEKATLLIEERRLCYVAFTRTKTNLFLTFSSSYNSEPNSATPSTFLTEINYTNNPNIEYIKDNEQNSSFNAPSSRYDSIMYNLKKQIIESLDSDDFQSIFNKVAQYQVLRDKVIPNFKELFKITNLDQNHLKNLLEIYKSKKSNLKFDPDSFTFSPSALLQYDDCPKKFELSNILQMPEVKNQESNSANVGTFIHAVLQDGVFNGFKELKQFEEYAKKLSKESKYELIDLNKVNKLLKVFYERNKDKYDSTSLVEEPMTLELEGFKFYGIADRIDFFDGCANIIDYKTGKAPDVKHRNWQLGYYALASISKGYKPNKLILDMLKLEKPVEMTVDGDDVSGKRIKGFKLSEVKQEFIDTAKKIVNDYESEFKVTNNDNKCIYCGYKFYCPKWEN